MKVPSAEPPRTASPFAPPASLASEEAEVRTFLGEDIFRLARRSETAFQAIFMQLALLGLIPVIALLVWLVEPSSQSGEQLHDYAGPLILGVYLAVHLYSAWAVYWLADALEKSVHSRWSLVGWALIPLLGLLLVVHTHEEARARLRERSLPLGPRGLDWTAVNQMAAVELVGGFYEPFGPPGRNQLYNLIFCDDLRLMESFEADKVGIGWPKLSVEFIEPAPLRQLLSDASADTRLRLLAAQQLRELGESIEDERVLGVVFEASQANSIYQVAFYADGRAICLHGPSGTMHEPPRPSRTADDVQQVIEQVDHLRNTFTLFPFKRPPPPPPAEARITLLTPQGRRNAQASWLKLFQHSSTNIVAEAAVRLADRMIGYEPAEPVEEEADLPSQDAFLRQMLFVVQYHRWLIQLLVVQLTTFVLLWFLGLLIGPIPQQWSHFPGLVLFGASAVVSCVAVVLIFRLSRRLHSPLATFCLTALACIPCVSVLAIVSAIASAYDYLSKRGLRVGYFGITAEQAHLQWLIKKGKPTQGSPNS